MSSRRKAPLSVALPRSTGPGGGSSAARAGGGAQGGTSGVSRRAAGPRSAGAGRRLRTSLISCAVIACLLAGWLLWDNARLVTTTYTVSSPRLPAAFDGMRLVQVSDLHSRAFGPGNADLLEAIAEAQPDAILLTGDLIDRTSTDPGVALDLAERARQIAPVYYVTGNHEGASSLRAVLLAGLRERGVEVLAGSSLEVARGSEVLRFAGVDDPLVAARGATLGGAGADAGFAAQLDAVRTGPGDPFTVLLAHRPERIEDYAAAGADVVLAGHAHGGQVRLPLIGGLIAPGQGLLPALTSGVVQRGGTQMVISRGLGNSLAPIRVNNPAELVVVTLQRG